MFGRPPTTLAMISCALVVLAGCASGNDSKRAATPSGSTPPRTSTHPTVGEPILITTSIELPTGKVLDGSTIGHAPFCPGGTISDTHGTAEIGLVDRTITCQDGTLRMGFDPQQPVGHTQSGPWRLISGTGTYQGRQGSGDMVIRYDPNDTSEHPTKGGETFTGSITP